MHPSIVTVLALAVTTATAFNVTLYQTTNCTGTTKQSMGEIKVPSGCQKVKDIKGSVKIEWTDEADNDLVFSTYSSDKCCIGKYHTFLMWQDECLELRDDKSFRVIGAQDVEKGKAGQSYVCND